MKQIRNNTFETNSSSTHSIALVKETEHNSHPLSISDDDYVHVTMGEFGWEIEDYDEPYDKLQYLVTMCAVVNGLNPFWGNYGDFGTADDKEEAFENFMQCDDFRRISDVVAWESNCRGVILDVSEGYIDHQSAWYNCLDEFLHYWSVDIEEFIYGNVVVHTDNDNH